MELVPTHLHLMFPSDSLLLPNPLNHPRGDEISTERLDFYDLPALLDPTLQS